MGVRQAHSTVEIEDHQPSEDDQGDPVDDRHGSLDRKAEESHERNDEGGADDEQQAAEEPEAPGGQVVRDQRADEAEDDHDGAGDEQDLQDR